MADPLNKDEVLAKVLPQFFPAHWIELYGIAHKDFPSRIRIGYVLCDEGRYRYIQDYEYTALQLPAEDLHSAALANLRQLQSGRLSIAKVPGGFEGWLWSDEDNFAAARILLPVIQQQFHDELGDTFFVTIPHRDDCFCWSPAQSPERQEKHASEAMEAFLKEQYNLTPDILSCKQGEFRLHRQQPMPD